MTNDMNDMALPPKPLWKSKTAWATAITAVLGAYECLKPIYSLPEVPPAAFVILGALGLYGRVKATQPIG